MAANGRRIIGIIAANVSDIEQREILEGAIERAQSLNIDIAVISNIYNPVETAEVLKTENKIYDLILSDEYDGFILISEAIINPDLQNIIKENLTKQSDIPVVVVGTPLPGFTLPWFHFINTSDENDIEDICDHLTDVHGFTDIHILTGHRHLAASHKRIEGYIRSLEKHGIAYSEDKVFFGDYWTSSGREFAGRYINGELPYPEALVCCNDYMAYGLLDEFMEADIDITEKMAVTGYEYIRERRNHNPLLTTYRRNRKALGKEAVRLITEKLDSGSYGEFSPPKGIFIPGDTCPCGTSNADIRRECSDIQTKAVFDFLNLFSQFEHRLTECRNIDELVARSWDFQYMIRNVNKLYMCLYENWYDTSEASENMVRYNLLFHEEPVIFNKYRFSGMFREEASPYYFCPLFFHDRELGYIVMRFEKPDVFDPVFRNWLKSLSNSLEFLRMKNDIQYLTECQSIAEQRDTLTGMLNGKGLRNALKLINNENMYMVMMRINTGGDSLSPSDRSEGILAVPDAAEAVKQFCGNRDNCGRTDDNTLVCFAECTQGADFLSDRLAAIMYRRTDFIRKYGVDSFACSAVRITEKSFSKLHAECERLVSLQLDEISRRRLSPHYNELNGIRRYYYTNPKETFDSEKIYRLFNGSAGYLRSVFRKCYGFTLHEDCENVRIAMAKYYLCVTTLSVSEIADKCGYTDEKYLMRQFRQKTGMSAVQYRNISI